MIQDDVVALLESALELAREDRCPESLEALYHAELETSADRIRAYIKEGEAKMDRICALTHALSDANRKVDTLNTEVAELRVQVERLEMSYVPLTENEKELHERVVALNTEIAELKAEFDQKHGDSDMWERAAQDLRDEAKVEQKKIAELREEVETLKTELEISGKSEAYWSKNYLEEREAAKGWRDMAHAKIENLGDTANSLCRDLATCKGEIESYRIARERLLESLRLARVEKDRYLESSNGHHAKLVSIQKYLNNYPNGTCRRALETLFPKAV